MSVMRYRLIITPRAEYVTITPPAPPPEEEYEMPFYAAVDPDGNIGQHGAIVLEDNAERTVRIEFMVPPDISSITKAVIVIVPAATGNLYWGVATDFAQLDAGENYNINTDSIAANATAVIANKMTSLNIITALTGATSYDVVGLEFTRYGDNVLDTIGNTVYFIGAYIE